MRRVKLWEDTVVMSIRDMQWMNEISRYRTRGDTDLDVQADSLLKRIIPPGLVKLDGRVESKLGDVVLKAGERFFIVEVKSNREYVKTEWRRHGKYKPKWPLKRLAELVEYCSSNSGEIEAREMLERSIRGHLVAYWTGVEDDGVVRGWVEARPYIIACSMLRNFTERAHRIGMSMPPGIKSSIFYTNEKNPLYNYCPLKHLMEGQVQIKLGANTYPSVFGLDREDFLKYINFLCGLSEVEKGFALPSDDDSDTEKQEKIHALVLTTHGSFFEVVASTNSVATLLDGIVRPTTKLKRSVRGAYSHDSLGAAPMG